MTSFVPIDGKGSPIVSNDPRFSPVPPPPGRENEPAPNQAASSPHPGQTNASPANRGPPTPYGILHPIQTGPRSGSAPLPPPNFAPPAPMTVPPGNMMYHNRYVGPDYNSAPPEPLHVTLQKLHERVVENDKAAQERYDLLRDKHNELRTDHIRLTEAYDRLDTKLKKKMQPQESGIETQVQELERRIVILDAAARKGKDGFFNALMDTVVKDLDKRLVASLDRIIKLEEKGPTLSDRRLAAIDEKVATNMDRITKLEKNGIMSPGTWSTAISEKVASSMDRITKLERNDVALNDRKFKAVDEILAANKDRIAKLENNEDLMTVRRNTKDITALHDQQNRLVMRIADSETKLREVGSVRDQLVKNASKDALNELSARVKNVEQRSKSPTWDDKYTNMLEQVADVQRQIAAIREDKLTDVAARLENHPNIAALSLVDELSKRVDKIKEISAFQNSNEATEQTSKQHHERLLRLEESTKVTDLAETVARFDQRVTDVDATHSQRLSDLHGMIVRVENRYQDKKLNVGRNVEQLAKNIAGLEDLFNKECNKYDNAHKATKERLSRIENDDRITKILRSVGQLDERTTQMRQDWEDRMSEHLSRIENDDRVTKLLSSVGQLNERTAQFKNDWEDLDERMDRMRESITKIRADGLKDVKEVGDRLHIMDKEKDQNLTYLEAELKVMRIKVERMELVQRRQEEQGKQFEIQPAVTSLADQIRSLRRRIEQSEPSEVERREISSLFQAMIERSPAAVRRDTSIVTMQDSELGSVPNAPAVTTPVSIEHTGSVFEVEAEATAPSATVHTSDSNSRNEEDRTKSSDDICKETATESLAKMASAGLTRSRIEDKLRAGLRRYGKDWSEALTYRSILQIIDWYEEMAKAENPSVMLSHVNTLIATYDPESRKDEKEEDCSTAVRAEPDVYEIESTDDGEGSEIAVSEVPAEPRRSKRDNLGHMKHYNDMVTWAEVKEDRRAEKRQRIS